MRRPTNLLKLMTAVTNPKLMPGPITPITTRGVRSLLRYITHLEDALACAEDQVARKGQMLNETINCSRPAFPARRKVSTP